MRVACLALVALLWFGALTPQVGLAAEVSKAPLQKQTAFAENPIVYFLMTDRFLNGNPKNDASYGRKKDGQKEIGTFHGGDFAGITQKLKEGYFRDLGVNALWITVPFEQIHGYTVGGGGKDTFAHYPYHGYFVLDFTRLDANWGTENELREMIDTAHAQGIRVLFDVVMNHPGYADMQTLNEYGVDVLKEGWQNATLSNFHSFIDYKSNNWANWWGPQWVRAGLGGGYENGGKGNLTMQVAYLPDFKTESEEPVDLPPILKAKKDTRAKAIEGYSVRQYLSKWMTDWVREYGVDGFRCDTAKHVEMKSWALLKQDGVKALKDWKAKNPTKKIDDADFWTVAEVFPHGVNKDAYFTAGGFDSVLNFEFQDAADRPEGLDSVYSQMASRLIDQKFDVLSYLSSHDTRLFDRANLINGGSALMLAPGGVQIYYGDETARPAGPSSRADREQATRSDMNWSEANADVLAHWKILGQFRLRHPAIARGEHQRLSEQPYVFTRMAKTDRVVVGMNVPADAAIPVEPAFTDGAKLRDAYTGARYVVKAGKVTVKPGRYGLVLLEAAP